MQAAFITPTTSPTIVMMLKSLLLAATLMAPMAAQAEIVICPKNGRPYDTSHGYYVDVPGTDYYVAPSKRPRPRATTQVIRNLYPRSSYSTW